LEPVTKESFEDLLAGLSQLISDAAARHLLASVAKTEPTKDEDTNAEETQLNSLILLLQAIHGAKLRRAYQWWRADPDDWLDFSREVFYDELAEAWLVEATIGKVNGETIRIRCSPNSMLTLATYFLRTFEFVPVPAVNSEDALRGAAKIIHGFEEKFLAHRSDSPALEPPDRIS
jgi:hypothetical protein